MPTPSFRRRTAALLAAAALAVTLTACSDNSHSATSGGVAAQSATDNGAAPALAAPGTTTDRAKGGGTAAAVPADSVQRSIIYDGSLTVRVSDVDAAANAAGALAAGAGGYVGSDTRTLDANRSSATVSLRVPSAHFESTVAALAGLGKAESRHVNTQDVTEQVIDVQSRLATQQASVNRIRALLAQATTIPQIVSIESELTQRESDLESMEAQLRSLTDLTSLSTITVILLGPDGTAAPKPKQAETGFVAGLKHGWHAFLSSMNVLFTIIGVLLPFAVAIGVIAWIVLWFLRRRRPALGALATAGGPLPAPTAAARPSGFAAAPATSAPSTSAPSSPAPSTSAPSSPAPSSPAPAMPGPGPAPAPTPTPEATEPATPTELDTTDDPDPGPAAPR